MNLTLGFYIESVPFSKATRDGLTSLGGSESACVALARALATRGHDVHICAADLAEDAIGRDASGVMWHPAEMTDRVCAMMDFDVFTVLRMWTAWGFHNIHAKLRVLWNQDLLHDQWPIMSTAWAPDWYVYVSDYQRRQWEERQPELKGHAWITKNPVDLSAVPAQARKAPHRAIYVSRPERGLGPLLEMWPALRKAIPDAELHLCRYSSMYDAKGWGKVCAAFDAEVERVNQKVGGITWLGELTKPQLYQAISDAAVMWYPGVPDFAETACIAAVETQACGTPFVGSYKGALPETIPTGVLIKGDATTPLYQENSVRAVVELMRLCEKNGRDYRILQDTGREFAKSYAADVVAGEWESWLLSVFADRRKTQPMAILRQLLHEDDHTAAQALCSELLTDGTVTSDADQDAIIDAAALCQRVIRGEDQTAEDYGARSYNDAISEAAQTIAETENRINPSLDALSDCTNVLDVAGGNGFFAILLARANPDVRVTLIDYSAANIQKATEAFALLGVQDRLTATQGSAFDYETQRPLPLPFASKSFDGLFCGEFLEHVADAPALIDHLESYVKDGGVIVYTVPHGPMIELLNVDVPLKRGHVHHFGMRDLTTLFGRKLKASVTYYDAGVTVRGNPVGHWIASYRVDPSNGPAQPRDLGRRALTTRPKVRLSAGMLLGPGAASTLKWCLESVYAVADEIVVGLSGAEEDAIALAKRYHAKILDIGPIPKLEGGFSEARNRVLDACSGEWFLWIDADERLVHPEYLCRYIGGPIFNGVALHQTHLMLDAPLGYDTPVRVFRRDQGITFFGCIHEQPGLDDGNGDILPTLEVSDTVIAHLGYLTEQQRRGKMLQRNLALLERDSRIFPKRRLGRVLILRDLVNLADYFDEAAGGTTTRGQNYRQAAVDLFKEHFADPSDKFAALARPWYERALRIVNPSAVEVELAIGGKVGGMNGHKAKSERVWIESSEELNALIAHRARVIEEQMRPRPLHTDPFGDIETEPAIMPRKRDLVRPHYTHANSIPAGGGYVVGRTPTLDDYDSAPSEDGETA